MWSGEPHSLDAGAAAGTPDGVHVLRVVARNRSGRKTTAAAVQWMDFELNKAARE